MINLEQVLKGLADINRLRIVNLLLHGELCVCDIQRVLESPQPNVSRHLTYLRGSGLVLDRREGPRIYYRLALANEGAGKRLYSFLQAAFVEDQVFKEDTRRLQAGVESGICNAVQWRPYSALARSRSVAASRARA